MDAPGEGLAALPEGEVNPRPPTARAPERPLNRVSARQEVAALRRPKASSGKPGDKKPPARLRAT